MLSEHPFGRLWGRLQARLRPAPIATPGELQTFVGERAFFLAQKCAIDYCRGKIGVASNALFEEKTFLDALEICRWETYVTVLGDLLILVEGMLRPAVAAQQREQLRNALVALHAGALARQALPAHRAQGWGDAIDAFILRLEAACLREPQQALDVADHSARRLFDTLPIHASMRDMDHEVVYGAVRFRMIALSDEMRKRLAAAQLVRQLLA